MASEPMSLMYILEAISSGSISEATSSSRMSTVLFSTPTPTKEIKMKIPSLKRMPASFKLSTQTLKHKPPPIPNFSRKIPRQDMKPSTKVKEFEMSASCRSCGLEQTRRPDGRVVEGIQNPVEQVFAMILSKEDCSYCRGEEDEMALFKQLQMAGKLKEAGKLSVPESGRRRRARRERVEGEKEPVEKTSIEKDSTKEGSVKESVKKESLRGWTITRKSVNKNSAEKNSIENVSVSIQAYVPIISPPDMGFKFALVF